MSLSARKLPQLVGYAGGCLGLVITAVFGYQYSSIQPSASIGIIVVGITLYGTSPYLVRAARNRLLLWLLLILIPLNIISLASVGLLFLPATILLVISAVLFHTARV